MKTSLGHYMKAKNVLKTYYFEPSYIEKDGHLRLFQAQMIDFYNDIEKKIALVSAPTGSGKTYGFSLLGIDNKTTFIIFPNNLLSRETSDSLIKSGQQVAILNAKEINRCMYEFKGKGFINFTRRKAIEYILSNKKFIVTNPTIYFNLLKNTYDSFSKEDMITTLIQNNVTTIIFDEFHVYSRDQAAKLISSIFLFRNDIKFVFSSATLPAYLKEMIDNLFGENRVSTIKVKKINEVKNSSILQGPLNVNIFKGSAESFVSENIELLKNENWFFILDSIRNIHNTRKELISLGIKKEEIIVISAYDDPSYEKYESLKNVKLNNARIVIGSNIVEQGINPPSNFTNFIIEPGYSCESFIQRAGRVGRNTLKSSNLIVAFESTVSSFPEAQNIDELFSFFSNISFRKWNDIVLKEETIGTYLWFFINKLTPSAAKSIYENIKGSKVASKVYMANKINKLFSNKDEVYKTRRYIREINDIIQWWNDFKDSVYKFISSDDSVSILDISEEFSDSYEGFSTDYSNLWIKANKEILENNTDGFVIVRDFLESPNFDFQIKVYGIPFVNSGLTLRYGDILFKGRSLIIDSFEKHTKMYINLPEDLNDLLINLKRVVKDTAGIERLRIEML